MADRMLLRLSASLLFISAVISLVADSLHPNREFPNNHMAVFAEYAQRTNWTTVHFSQFAGTIVFIAGLEVLFFALNITEGSAHWLGFFAAISAGIGLALAGFQYAVDGVALKQAVDAWANAPAAEQAIRFANAETIRWLEWGITSYADFMVGLALALFGMVIVWTSRVPRPIGILLGLSGMGFMIKGWVLGAEGFAPSGATPSSAATIFLGAGILWLLIVAWRMKAIVQVAPAQAIESPCA
jgi:hypothetical protein